MENPIRRFMTENSMRCSELARRSKVSQPLVHKHAYYDQRPSVTNMDAYASAGIDLTALWNWNLYLSHKKQRPITGDHHVEPVQTAGGKAL